MRNASSIARNSSSSSPKRLDFAEIDVSKLRSGIYTNLELARSCARHCFKKDILSGDEVVKMNKILFYMGRNQQGAAMIAGLDIPDTHPEILANDCDALNYTILCH